MLCEIIYLSFYFINLEVNKIVDVCYRTQRVSIRARVRTVRLLARFRASRVSARRYARIVFARSAFTGAARATTSSDVALMRRFTRIEKREMTFDIARARQPSCIYSRETYASNVPVESDPLVLPSPTSRDGKPFILSLLSSHVFSSRFSCIV